MTLATLATILIIHLMAAVSPGPSFVVSVRTAANDGFGAAVALALGFGLGAVLWAIAALLGLAVLFELVPSLFLALKICGGLFLLWIAVQMWRHAPTPLPDKTQGHIPKTPGQAFRMGFLTFATNPKPAVFFGAVFVGLVPPDTPTLWLAAIVTGVFVNETIWYILVARIFSLDRARRIYANVKTAVDRTLAVLIAGFGLKIALG